jgi:hypothetical protein
MGQSRVVALCRADRQARTLLELVAPTRRTALASQFLCRVLDPAHFTHDGMNYLIVEFGRVLRVQDSSRASYVCIDRLTIHSYVLQF